MKRMIIIYMLAFPLLLVSSANSAAAVSDIIQVDDYPRDLVVDPILETIFVANYRSGTISVIDVNNMTLKDTIALGIHPVKIEADLLQHRLFVSDNTSGVMTVIDGITYKILDKIDIGSSLWKSIFNERTSKLYVSDPIEKKIVVIDTNSMRTVQTINFPSSPRDMAIDQRNNVLYVVDGTFDSLHVVDLNTNTVQDVNVDIIPWGVSVNESNQAVYLTGWNTNKIVVLDEITLQKKAEIMVTPGTLDIETSQIFGTTLAVNESTKEIYVIDNEANLINTIIAKEYPSSIAIHPFSNKAYIASSLENIVFSVSFIEEDNIDSMRLIQDKEYSKILKEAMVDIINMPQQDIDSETVSELLKNIGVTGKFDGNEVARILIDEYNKKKESQPTSAIVPQWTKSMMRILDPSFNAENIPQLIDCRDNSFAMNWEEFNVVKTWLKILPICALG